MKKIILLFTIFFFVPSYSVNLGDRCTSNTDCPNGSKCYNFDNIGHLSGNYCSECQTKYNCSINQRCCTEGTYAWHCIDKKNDCTTPPPPPCKNIGQHCSSDSDCCNSFESACNLITLKCSYAIHGQKCRHTADCLPKIGLECKHHRCSW